MKIFEAARTEFLVKSKAVFTVIVLEHIMNSLPTVLVQGFINSYVSTNYVSRSPTYKKNLMLDILK